MTLMSNCGHDGRGLYVGDIPGDQTGEEWCLCGWVDFGQNAVARHPDPHKRAMIADFAKKSAENDCVGYDQDDRLSFWHQLQVVGFDPSNIYEPCNADCSSGVAAILKSVGMLTDDELLFNIPAYMTTWYELLYLDAAGFIIYYDDSYTRTDENLLAGDIIIRADQHTNIVVEGRGEEIPYDPDIAFAQTMLNVQLARRGWAQVVVDGSYGPITAGCLIEIAQEWMLASMDPTVTITGFWYEGWIAALNLHPIRQGMSCSAVYCVKTALIGKGYKGPALSVDTWDFTSELTQVVKQFQSDHGLPVTGRVDSDTYFAMTHFE